MDKFFAGKITNKIRDNKRPIIIAFVQWFLTTVFQIDRLFFTYSSETKIYVGIKILYFIFLVIAWCFLFYVHKKVREKDEIYKRGLHIFSCYLFIMMVLLVFLWPGTWAYDDMLTLVRIQYYDDLYSWHHILTGTYQDILLQILPFQGGITLLQNVIISVCVAFSITKLETSFKIKRLKYKSIDTIVKIIPFLLFPVLIYQFSGYRMGIYIYLELVMLVMLICAVKDNEWSLGYSILFSILCAVVAAWRTESFFYIPLSCFLILTMSKVILPNGKKAVCIVLLFIGFLGINAGQNHFMKNNNYEVISLARPCAELVRVANREEDAELLADIDKVMDLQVIYDNPEINGESLYWGKGLAREDYTKEEYSGFLKSFIKLSVKYPKTVIAERGRLFIEASGITGSIETYVNGTANVYNENSNNAKAQAVLSRGWIADKPVFKEMRKSVVYFLGGKKADGTVIVPLNRMLWNVVIPIAILLFAWIRLLVRKKWYLFIICTVVLIRLSVVVLTEPSAYIMYFLSFYLLGYVYLVYQLLILFSQRKQIEVKKGKVR